MKTLENLIYIIEVADLNMTEIASRSGVSKRSLYNWVNHTVEPSDSRFEQVWTTVVVMVSEDFRRATDVCERIKEKTGLDLSHDG